MTVDTIVQGSTRTYTAIARGQSFTISNNTGQFARIFNLTVDGKPATEPGIGPNPERRTIGPLSVGDAFTIAADIGQVLVEYDTLADSDTAPRTISVPYTLQPTDDKATLVVTAAVTITVPLGLTLVYGVLIRCPSSGTVTVAPGTGAVLLNGVSASVGRTRTTGPSGFSITPNAEANSWGVTNSIVAQSFLGLAGLPTDNVALAAALALKADVASVPLVLLRSQGPRQGAAQGAAQIFSAGSGNPSQVQLAAGQLATPSQRISVRTVATKNGTTDSLVILLYLGTAGTTADTTIGTTGVLSASIVYFELEWIIARLTATTIQVYVRQIGSSTAIPTLVATVANLDTNALALSVGYKTGATDKPTMVDLQMELR